MLYPVLACRWKITRWSQQQRADRLLEATDHRGARQGRASRSGSDTELVVRASGRARARTGRPASATVALERLLRKVGQSAKERGSGVLVTIDEAHAVRKPQLAILAASLQVVVKRASLPIAVVFAGLPQLRQASHGAGTFFERMPVLDVGYLSRDSSPPALFPHAIIRSSRFSGPLASIWFLVTRDAVCRAQTAVTSRTGM
jgi:hypothetical protein